MASIRKLKKDINYLAYELLTEAFTYKYFHPGVKEKKLDEVISKVVKSRSELLMRVNNPDGDDNSSKAEHFRKIKEDMVNMVAILDDLQDKNVDKEN